MPDESKAEGAPKRRRADESTDGLATEAGIGAEPGAPDNERLQALLDAELEPAERKKSAGAEAEEWDGDDVREA